MGRSEDVSSLTLNRLSVYLRCLHQLEEEGVHTISSQELADRFRLSSSQIRKDLAHFGEFGVRGVGYDVHGLARALHRLLGLDRDYRLVLVGMGNLGSALARYLGFNSGSFRVVAGVDKDSAKVGRCIAGLTVRHTDDLTQVVAETGAEIGILAVPAESAQANYDALRQAGVRAVLNFAPVRVVRHPDVPLKDVDLRINLEELAYILSREV
jgi:redox-sensing transcriptional repressor